MLIPPDSQAVSELNYSLEFRFGIFCVLFATTISITIAIAIVTILLIIAIA